MPKKRLNIEFEIDNTHLELIEDIAKEYKISSNSKAIRILLDYVAKDADSSPHIFPGTLLSFFLPFIGRKTTSKFHRVK